MPHRKPHRHLPKPLPPSAQYGPEYVKQMALRSASYLDKFDKHASQIQDDPDLEDVYNKLICDAHALPPGAAFTQCRDSQGREEFWIAMEGILCQSGVSTEDQLMKCFVAHGLIITQLEAMSSLPLDVRARIDERMVELRSQRDIAFESQGNPGSAVDLFDSLIPPPLPDFKPPTKFRRQALTKNKITELLASPHDLIGQQFIHHFFDVLFRISEVQCFLHGTQFHLQYKGTIDSLVLASADLQELFTGCDVIQPKL